MKAYNTQISKSENDDEDIATYKRMASNSSDLDEFLKKLVSDDSRFFLPIDENGKQMLAIKIEDIIRIYYEIRDA